jgi:hypothetical protein
MKSSARIPQQEGQGQHRSQRRRHLIGIKITGTTSRTPNRIATPSYKDLVFEKPKFEKDKEEEI